MRYPSTIHALSALGAWCDTNKVHAPFVNIWTCTFPPMLKKCRDTGEPNPYVSGVKRIACRYGQIGCSYERCTNSLRGRIDMIPLGPDGEPVWFRAEGLWGGKGEHVPGDPFLCRHKEYGTLYLAFKPRQRPVDGGVMIGYDKWYDVAGNREIECPKTYLPKEKPLPIGKIPWRTVEVANITEIDCGVRYEVAA